MEISRAPLLVVISGPSGAGKSTVVDRVLARSGNFSRSISVTTREHRGEERNGEQYVFVYEEEFLRRRDAGAFLEWAEVHGNLYGTPADFVDMQLARGVNVMLEIDVQGGMNVKKAKPDAVLIFLFPPSFRELVSRLRGRATDAEDVIRKRLENAVRELTFYTSYDYLVVNDDIERCVDDVCTVIRAELLSRSRTSVDIGITPPEN